MSKFDTYKIKWRSTRYPELVLYEEEYSEMRPMFTYVKSFRDEMIDLEKWLFANEQRIPKTKAGWVKQVRNWMRLADRFKEQKYLQALVKGKVKDQRMTAAEAGLRLAQILKRKQAAEAQEAKVQGKKTEVKRHVDPVAFGDALAMIGGKQ